MMPAESGVTKAGARVCSKQDLMLALRVLPATSVVGVLAATCLRETHCRQRGLERDR